MSNTNDARPCPVIPVLVPWLRGQPTRRPYVVMRRAEEHYRELLVFLQEMGRSSRENTGIVATACHAELAQNKITIVVSSVAELEAVKDEAMKADIAGRLQILKTSLAEARHLLKM